MGYSLSIIDDFQNDLIFWNNSSFLKNFFSQNNSKLFVKYILKCLLQF